MKLPKYILSGAQALGRAHFGRGSGPILLDDVGCSGSETSLINCSYDSNTNDCNHFEDASVICTGEKLACMCINIQVNL